MACITLVAPMAMATTELTRAIHCEHAWTWQFQENVERKSLSMSWVVVTDGNGNRKLQVHWTPSADIR